MDFVLKTVPPFIHSSTRIHESGQFLNTKSMYFMDYKTFYGHQTPFYDDRSGGKFSAFGLLHLQHARTNIFPPRTLSLQKVFAYPYSKVRMLGASENFFVNYLATPRPATILSLATDSNGILACSGLSLPLLSKMETM